MEPGIIRAERVDLPQRLFFYTLDQVAVLLGVELEELTQFVHFVGAPAAPKGEIDPLKAYKVAPLGNLDPSIKEWRVPEDEFVAWLHRAGIKVAAQIYAGARGSS